jgi:hypothetical protein
MKSSLKLIHYFMIGMIAAERGIVVVIDEEHEMREAMLLECGL